MKKLAHFCGIMLAATSFMFQSCDDSDGYSSLFLERKERK